MHLDGFLLWIFRCNLYKITQIVRLLAIMYLSIYRVICMLTKSSDMLNKNTLGVKKYEAKKNQRLKTLISNKAKKSVNESAT